MRIQLIQVDAFTDKTFGGNSAAVCPLDRWLPDALLQSIASENNLSETAYFVPNGDGYELRWFTPVAEIDLAGHPTLATAWVMINKLGIKRDKIVFHTKIGDTLVVTREGDRLAMDFPARPPAPKNIGDVAAALGAKPAEIVFTGGGTEADNLAIKGAAWAASARGRELVTTSVEHKAVLHACAVMERFGFRVTYLPVDRYGRVDPADVEAVIREHTTVVSVMYANNEVGTVQRIAEIGAVVRATGALFHVDAVQAAPHLPLDVNRLQADLLSLSAHKLGGPKGVGALFVRQGTALLAQLSGGSQERQRRAGTENVAGIVGFARALELAQEGPRDAENARLAALRDGLVSGLTALPGVRLTGHPTERLPNNASFVLDGVEGGDLVAALDLEGIAASTGSACTTGSSDPSHVLLAMGFDPEQAHGSLRLTLGAGNAEEDVQLTVEATRRVLERMRTPQQPRPEVASV
jgi:cysteine desulfurase